MDSSLLNVPDLALGGPAYSTITAPNITVTLGNPISDAALKLGIPDWLLAGGLVLAGGFLLMKVVK